MIKKLVHFSDLHVKLFKDHDQYRKILENSINQWKEIKPDRIVFTGDLVHSKNQMTPELIEFSHPSSRLGIKEASSTITRLNFRPLKLSKRSPVKNSTLPPLGKLIFKSDLLLGKD